MTRLTASPACALLVAAACFFLGRDAVACQCNRSLQLSSVGAEQTLEQGTPLLFTTYDDATAPKLYSNGRELKVNVRTIRSDAWCPGSLTAYFPTVELEPQTPILIVDPVVRESVRQIPEERWEEMRSDPHFDETRYVYEYPLKVTLPRPVLNVDLSVQIDWHRAYPWPYEDALCGGVSDMLRPYLSQGHLTIRVAPQRDAELQRPEFYVSARVRLPGPTPTT